MSLVSSAWSRALVILALPAALTGCSGPNAQVARCQSEKQELLAVIEQEKVRSKQFEQRALALESRLDQSEKQLAQLVHPGSRFGEDEPRTASSKGPRPLDAAPPLPAAPVREPKAGAAPAPASGARSKIREMKLTAPEVGPAAEESVLASLAERDPRLEYDPSSRTARLKIDVPFDADGSGLTGQGRQRLDEVAAWLKSPQTSHLRILVAGHSSNMRKPPSGADVPRYDNDRQLAAARAMAVADYLDRRGIKEDRLAVIGSGAKGSPAAGSAAGAVEIVLSEPETPIAGLPSGPVRR